MVKKTDRKPADRVRLSLVSPSLNSALTGTTELATPQEPWRERKRKGSKKGKRKN
jgi:hypothetical protein